MATLADLKARIADDMTRDDMGTGEESESTLLAHIQKAVRYYSNERFWFNVTTATVNTVGSTSTVARPATIRIADRVTIPANNAELEQYQMDQLPLTDGGGTPLRFVNDGDNILLHPTPDGVFTLKVYGIKQVDEPALDADDNIWTNEAADLIAARTRFSLYRDVYFFPDKAQATIGDVQECLSYLRRETRKRLSSPLRTDAGSMMTGHILHG